MAASTSRATHPSAQISPSQVARGYRLSIVMNNSGALYLDNRYSWWWCLGGLYLSVPVYGEVVVMPAGPCQSSSRTRPKSHKRATWLSSMRTLVYKIEYENSIGLVEGWLTGFKSPWIIFRRWRYASPSATPWTWAHKCHYIIICRYLRDGVGSLQPYPHYRPGNLLLCLEYTTDILA